MVFNSVRAIFVVAFVVNCIIWSQGRYNSGARRLAWSADLAKRSFDSINDLPEKECRPLAFPTSAQQCAHVLESCPTPDTFVGFHYVSFYFCAEPSIRPFAFLGLLTWLLFLFSTLGISASDFFTPNLATIAQLLGLDENVAGVTFLAFGNGSPDVFATFSAMRADSGSLAIGELLGAASFIVSCVVGSMCIIKPFKVNRGPFLRDVGFFTIAVSLLLVTLSDNHIHDWEAGMMIVLYIIYVITVVAGSWWERRQENKRRAEAVIRAEFEPDDDAPPSASFEEPYRDDPSTSSPLVVPAAPLRVRAVSHPGLPRIGVDTQHLRPTRTPSPSPSHRNALLPSFSLLGALEFRQVVASLQRQAAGSSLHMFENPHPLYAGGHYRARTLSHVSSVSSTNQGSGSWDAALGVPLNDRSPARLLATQDLCDEPEDMHLGLDASHATIPSISRTPASPITSDGDTESQQFFPPTRRQRIFSIFSRIYGTLFPSLHHFKTKTFLGKIASIFAAPAVMALTLTLPVVVMPYEHSHISPEKAFGGEGPLIDFEEEGIERTLIAEEEVQEGMHELAFNKWLMAAQSILGPLFCAVVLASGTRHQMWLLVAIAICGLVLAILVVVYADRADYTISRMARCSMGFLVAIIWIMAIADEVVHVLQTFGFIFGLSDAIIGLTIFAVGNSLADLVANMSVAVFAPIMGFSACFGGPMLNILLGIGISGSYVTHKTSQPFKLHFSPTLIVSTIGLLSLLIATLIFVPFNGYFLSRRWGIFLITSYSIIMSLNIFVELKGRNL